MIQYTPSLDGFSEDICLVCKNYAGDEKTALISDITQET